MHIKVHYNYSDVCSAYQNSDRGRDFENDKDKTGPSLLERKRYDQFQ